MKIEAKVTEIGTKEDHYDVVIKTYKEKIVGVFERSEIRALIEVLDNSINVGCVVSEKVPISKPTNDKVV